MRVTGVTRALRWVFLPAVAIVAFFLAGVVCLMCQVLAQRDAPTHWVEGKVVTRDQRPVPVGGDFDTSFTLGVDGVDGRHYRVAAVGPGLDLRPGQQVVLSVSAVDGSVSFVRAGTALIDLRPGVLEPVLLIAASLLGLSGLLAGGIRFSTCPPLLIWVFLVVGVTVAPIAVFLRL